MSTGRGLDLRAGGTDDRSGHDEPGAPAATRQLPFQDGRTARTAVPRPKRPPSEQDRPTALGAALGQVEHRQQLGGGGDGEGSLIAAAVVVNTDDTVITLHIQ